MRCSCRCSCHIRGGSFVFFPPLCVWYVQGNMFGHISSKLSCRFPWCLRAWYDGQVCVQMFVHSSCFSSQKFRADVCETIVHDLVKNVREFLWSLRLDFSSMHLADVIGILVQRFVTCLCSCPQKQHMCSCMRVRRADVCDVCSVHYCLFVQLLRLQLLLEWVFMERSRILSRNVRTRFFGNHLCTLLFFGCVHERDSRNGL